MKMLFVAGGFVAMATAAANQCWAQSNVHSIGSSSSFVPARHNPDEVLVGAYTYDGGPRSYRVKWYTSTNLLAKQPRWDGVSTNAPLSVERACALALQHVRQRFPQVGSWALRSLHLRNPLYDDTKGYTGVWCYEVILAPRDPEARTRIEQEASYFAGMEIVLLDGTIVPSITLKKR